MVFNSQWRKFLSFLGGLPFKKSLIFIGGLLILSWVVFVNRFPLGYVIAGGDVPQFIELKENFYNFYYNWEGRALLFYFPFYLLDILGISESSQLSFYLGTFIFGSYLSFYFFTQLIFKKLQESFRVLLALFYALNLYTLYIFSYVWGYSSYQCLYIFIPILVGLFIKFLSTKKNIYGVFFVLVLFLGSSGFANPAFALAFAIFLALLLLFLGVSKIVRFDKHLFTKLAVLAGFSLLVNIYWILPVIPNMQTGVANLFWGNIIDLDWWLAHTSNSIMDTWRLMQYHNWYFPRNFPYPNLHKYYPIFYFLTLIPVFLVLLGLIFSKKRGHSKKLYLTAGALLIVFTMLVAKVSFPFEKINIILYNLWGFNTLRGYEKFAIFTPFIFSLLFASLAYFSQKKRIYLPVLVLLIFIVATPLPFYLGKLQQNTSAIFVRDTVDFSDKDYLQAKYSFLIKIPDEYYAIQDIINNDAQDVNIAILPYNIVDSVGWSNYPKWKLAGSDITRRLYRKDFIHANSGYFGGWFFANKFNNSNSEDPAWIVKLLGTLNAKYVIYHKDVEENFKKASFEKIKTLEKRGLLQNLTDNEYFTLYKIREDLTLPILSWQEGKHEIEPNPKSVVEQFRAINSDIQPANFKRINPKKYIVENVSLNPSLLIFAEPFNANWKAYAVNKDGKKKLIKEHYKARGYANGWEVKDSRNVDKIVITYLSMRLAYIGGVISGITLLFLSVYLLKYYYDYRRRN